MPAVIVGCGTRESTVLHYVNMSPDGGLTCGCGRRARGIRCGTLETEGRNVTGIRKISRCTVAELNIVRMARKIVNDTCAGPSGGVLQERLAPKPELIASALFLGE